LEPQTFRGPAASHKPQIRAFLWRLGDHSPPSRARHHLQLSATLHALPFFTIIKGLVVKRYLNVFCYKTTTSIRLDSHNAELIPLIFCRQMLRIHCNTHWAQFYLPLLVINALAFHVRSSTLPALSPSSSQERIWDSFAPDSSASTAAASSLPHPASNLETRSTCPPFNASVPQIQLSAPLENQIVDCGGSREYLYIINGSCSSDLFSMVVITVQDNSAPYAAVDISLFAPLPMNSTTYASRSPNRRYYMMQLLSTCPGM
jgi:hypothetical protein